MWYTDSITIGDVDGNEVEINVDDVLSELSVNDIKTWIDEEAGDIEKSILLGHLTDGSGKQYMLPAKTLADVYKIEALMEIWDIITEEDLEGIKLILRYFKKI